MRTIDNLAHNVNTFDTHIILNIFVMRIFYIRYALRVTEVGRHMREEEDEAIARLTDG